MITSEKIKHHLIKIKIESKGGCSCFNTDHRNQKNWNIFVQNAKHTV